MLKVTLFVVIFWFIMFFTQGKIGILLWYWESIIGQCQNEIIITPLSDNIAIIYAAAVFVIYKLKRLECLYFWR